jgi:hypothetical protein
MDKIILKPWCFLDKEDELYNIFDASYIEVVSVNDIENSNCILMSFLQHFNCSNIWISSFNYYKKNYHNKPFNFKNEYIDTDIDDISIRDFFFQKRELIKDKKLIFYISSEAFNFSLNFIINDLIKNFNINPFNIIILDSTFFSRGYDRPFYSPIELIIRNYRHIYHNLDCRYNSNIIYSNIRNKKICFNNFKYSEIRMISLLNMISVYDSVDTALIENDITAYDYKYKTEYPYYIEKNNYNVTINFPIRYESELDIDFNSGYNMYKEIFNSLKNSHFSIVTETNNNFYKVANNNIPMEFDLKKDRVQLSEKTINPFICGNLPFIIENYDFYRALMGVGYDFSYLEDIFGIDYKNNKIEDNFLKIKEFTTILKNMSIEDIELIRKKYISAIINNYEITVNALDGKLTEDSYIYLNNRLR